MVSRMAWPPSGTTIIGGGDSVAAVHRAGVADKMAHLDRRRGRWNFWAANAPGVAALNQK